MCAVSLERALQVIVVMINAVDLSIPLYAVIEARRTNGPPERFVIPYSDEGALRDLINGPSIIDCGFATRGQAEAHIDADVRKLPERERHEGQNRTDRRDVDRRVLSEKQRLRAAFDLMEAGGVVRGFLKAASAAATLTFFSGHSILASRGHLLQRCFAFRREEIPLAPAVARTTSL
jgi:hypothetical protein